MELPDKRLSEEETAAWVAFDAIADCGVGTRTIFHLYETFQGLAHAWEAGRADLADRNLGGLRLDVADKLIDARKKIDPLRLLDDIRKQGVWPYVFPDPFYPISLKHLAETAPAVLYAKGTVDDNAFFHSIGVVGTRRPTRYGEKVAKEIALGLAKNGVLIVSGLALGIDAIAHAAAIEGGGKTVAVLANGPDKCYPQTNLALYQAILDKGGAIVSEYPPGIEPEKWRFPQRNRIISGLSRGLVVIEAGDESGALITATLAFEQGRDVFAVPGRVDSAMSEGTHKIIRQHKAQLVRNYQDILDELNWITSSQGRSVTTVVELYGREREIYNMLSNEPMHFDVLCQKSGMEVGEMSATLTMLELAGIVVRHPGDWFSKNDPGASGYVQATLPNSG